MYLPEDFEGLNIQVPSSTIQKIKRSWNIGTGGFTRPWHDPVIVMGSDAATLRSGADAALRILDIESWFGAHLADPDAPVFEVVDIRGLSLVLLPYSYTAALYELRHERALAAHAS